MSEEKTRIVLDARMRFHRGVGTYLRGLFPEMVRQMPEVEWLLLHPDDGEWVVPGTRVIPSSTLPLSLAEHFVIPKLLREYRADWLFVPHFNAPLLWPADRTIAVIHDTIPLLFPSTFRPWVPPAFKYMATRLMRGAAAVFTDARVTAEQLRRIGDRQVEVVYPGLTPLADPAGDFLPPAPYIFAIAGKPHKNGLAVLRLFEKLKNKDMNLLLRQSTEEDGGVVRDAVAASSARERIIVVPELSSAELTAAYAGAEIFIFLSRWEGFGYPPLEAMQAQTPVLAGSGGALPEVLEDAALLVDVDDPTALLAAVRRLLNERDLRCELIERGRRKVEEYTWPEAAARMVASLRRVIK